MIKDLKIGDAVSLNSAFLFSSWLDAYDEIYCNHVKFNRQIAVINENDNDLWLIVESTSSHDCYKICNAKFVGWVNNSAIKKVISHAVDL